MIYPVGPSMAPVCLLTFSYISYLLTNKILMVSLVEAHREAGASQNNRLEKSLDFSGFRCYFYNTGCVNAPIIFDGRGYRVREAKEATLFAN